MTADLSPDVLRRLVREVLIEALPDLLVPAAGTDGQAYAGDAAAPGNANLVGRARRVRRVRWV